MLLASFVIIYVLGFINAGKAPEVQDNLKHILTSEAKPLPPEREHFPDELNSSKYPNCTESEARCGDVLIAQTGFISYKTNESYSNNERCIWTVRTPKWETRFLLLSWGFHSVNDHISLYVMDKDGVVQKKEQMDSENSPRWVGVIGPTVFVVFTSDQAGTGLGFELIFVEFGYNEVSGYVHNHSHLIAPAGRVMWPEKSLEQPINTFSTFVITPTLPTNVITLLIDKVDLMSLSLGCHFNYLSVHQLHENGLTLRLRYCEAELATLAKISSSSPLLITFSMSISSRHKGISFSWYQDKIL